MPLLQVEVLIQASVGLRTRNELRYYKRCAAPFSLSPFPVFNPRFSGIHMSPPLGLVREGMLRIYKHVAPLGLVREGMLRIYKHVAPLGLVREGNVAYL